MRYRDYLDDNDSLPEEYIDEIESKVNDALKVFDCEAYSFDPREVYDILSSLADELY